MTRRTAQPAAPTDAAASPALPPGAFGAALAAQGTAPADGPVLLRPPGLPGVELLHARGLRQRFARHFHRRYAVGVVEHGALEFRFLGRANVALPGSVNLTTPGEVHDGHPGSGPGWTYRMFYLDPDLVQRAAAEAAGRPVPAPDFAAGVLADPALAAEVQAVHRLLMDPGAPLLARQTRLLHMLALWIARHGDAARPLPRAGREPRAVARARAWLDAHCREDVSLDELARVAGLSPFHLARCFSAALGLPPHAYLLGLRVRLARELLAGPMRLADIAAETGFTDQAHLTHTFRRLTGLTPGRYRKFLQT